MLISEIDKVVENYRRQTSDGAFPEDRFDILYFFYGIMEIQAKWAQALSAEEYDVMPVDTRENLYWSFKPMLQENPVMIDPASYANCIEEVCAYLVENKVFEEDILSALAKINWQNVVAYSEFNLAGAAPLEYIASTAEAFSATDFAGIPAVVAQIIMAYALRPFLEGPARKCLSGLDLKQGNRDNKKPCECPVCGCVSSSSFVGNTPSSEGKGRMLYCSMCGSQWEFERIRCAKCGTQSPNDLHYFNVEGDTARRLHICGECGDYSKTVFLEDFKGTFIFEVEDVIMGYLDDIANLPEFNPDVQNAYKN